MASISTLGDSFALNIPSTTLTATVIGLDILGTASTTGFVNAGTYHVANTSPLHILMSIAGTAATAANTLLMPGERNITIGTGMKISIIKSAGAADGVFRATALA